MDKLRIETEIRQPEAADLSFVLNSYYLCLRNSPAYANVTNDVASLYLNPIIKNVLSRSKTLIACDPLNPEVIYGILVYGQETDAMLNTIHMLYVKKIFRSLGVASMLFNAAFMKNQPVIITCHTIPGFQTIKKLSQSVVFHNPFLLSTNV